MDSDWAGLFLWTEELEQQPQVMLGLARYVRREMKTNSVSGSRPTSPLWKKTAANGWNLNGGLIKNGISLPHCQLGIVWLCLSSS